MPRRTDGPLGFNNMVITDEVPNASHSGPTTISADSDIEEFWGARSILSRPRRPGSIRRAWRETVEVNEMAQSAQPAALQGARGDAPVSAPARLLGAQDQRRELQAVPGPGGVRVVARQTTLSTWIKLILVPTAVIFAATALVYVTTTHWTRVQRGQFWATSSNRIRVKSADLPLLPGCHSITCERYRSFLRSSINRSQNPCTNFYKFVCDGWRERHRLMTVVDFAADMMYSQVLNTIQRAPGIITSDDNPATLMPAVGKRVTDFVTSCMAFSKNSLQDLKVFMAERHLPWPSRSPSYLLEILLELSAKWNIHLWFQVTLDQAAYRNGTRGLLLKIGNSATFRAWIALMRTVSDQRREASPSLRYRTYIRTVLSVFGVSDSRAEELATSIQEMDRLTLEVLGPAIAVPEHKIVRMSIYKMAETMTPGIPTGRWLYLLNECFPWARPFTPNNEVQVENPGMLRAVAYLLGRKAETREALTLSLGLRVVSELGWMANKDIADATLQLMEIPWSAHTRRCLIQVENSAGVAWLSLFPRKDGVEALVQNVRDILVSDEMRRRNATLELSSRKGAAQWDVESYLLNVLPEPTPGESFFIIWKNMTSAHLRLQQRDLTNVIKPRSVLSHAWTINGLLTTSEEYFVFPLYHPDLPPAVNYGAAGRLLADEILRLMFYEPIQQHTGEYHAGDDYESDSEMLPAWSPYHVDTRALLTALKAYRLHSQRHTKKQYSEESRLANDRLFFLSSCYALCSSGDYMGELYGDDSRRCNVAAEALWDFRTAFRCDISKV